MTERDIINELRAVKGYDIKDNTVGYAETERLIRNVIEIMKTRVIIPNVVNCVKCGKNEGKGETKNE